MSRLPALPPVARTSMDPNKPEPGYWLIRMGRGRPPMPASIQRIWHEPGSVPRNYLDTGPIMIANIGWQAADPLKVWIARRLKPLTKREYDYHMARVSWVRHHSPLEPEASRISQSTSPQFPR